MVKTHVIDLTEAYDSPDVTTPQDLLLKTISKYKWFNGNLIYRAMCGQRKANLINLQGTDTPQYDSIMALTHEEVFVNPADPSLFTYLEGDGEPRVIAVYDSTKFETLTEFIKRGKPNPRIFINATDQWYFIFKEPANKQKALVALLFIKGI